MHGEVEIWYMDPESKTEVVLLFVTMKNVRPWQQTLNCLIL